MKPISLFSFLLTLIMISCSTSDPNFLGKMARASREAYMINLGNEVTLAFGPEYYRKYKRIHISKVKKYKDGDMRPEIQKNNGRKYYTVSFLYDPSKETLEWDFTSKIDIWQDTGEPIEIIFGNGYGINFINQSYEEQLRMTNRKIIPYQQAASVPDRQEE